MRKTLILLALALGLSATPTGAQYGYSDFMECSACQMILKMVELTAPENEKDLSVDMSRQCSLLKKEDQKACVQFYSTYGPKFIQAFKERRARGESVSQICAKMTYCQ